MENKEHKHCASFTINTLISGNVDRIKTMQPLVEFKEPNIVYYPTQWQKSSIGLNDENGTQMIAFRLNDDRHDHGPREIIEVRLAGEITLAKYKHQNDSDFKRLLFMNVCNNLSRIQKINWIERVDWFTLRVPECWSVEYVKDRTFVHDAKGDIVAQYKMAYDFEGVGGALDVFEK